MSTLRLKTGFVKTCYSREASTKSWHGKKTERTVRQRRRTKKARVTDDWEEGERVKKGAIHQCRSF